MLHNILNFQMSEDVITDWTYVLTLYPLFGEYVLIFLKWSAP